MPLYKWFTDSYGTRKLVIEAPDGQVLTGKGDGVEADFEALPTGQGGLTIDQVKADTDIADSLSKKHSNNLDHASGSDNQDISTLDTRVHATLSTGATAMAFATNKSVKVTPNAAATYTTTVPAAGMEAFLMVLTSGTTSRVITFGSGFKAVGTLTTGTVTAKVFVIHWISDGTNLYESGRTVAITA